MQQTNKCLSQLEVSTCNEDGLSTLTSPSSSFTCTMTPKGTFPGGYIAHLFQNYQRCTSTLAFPLAAKRKIWRRVLHTIKNHPESNLLIDTSGNSKAFNIIKLSASFQVPLAMSKINIEKQKCHLIQHCLSMTSS